MPVVALSYERLLRLISGSRKITKDVISQRLPYLGLDIESDDGNDVIRIEYSPNRPDYATDIGVSLALQGLLGVKKGLVPFSVKKFDDPNTTIDINNSTSSPYQVNVTRAVSKVRPILTGIVAKRGGILDDTLLRQLVTLQEDLHFGLGRNRKKVAIGLHDLAKINGKFPFTYTTVPASHAFVPLHENKEMSISEIIQNTKAGRAFGNLVTSSSLSNDGNFPIILDSDNNTVSLPPIINSNMTTITTDTTDIFVDVTGTSQYVAESALAIISLTLHAAGFDLESIHVAGGKNRTPPFETRLVQVSLNKANELLGLDLSISDAMLCLEKCRLGPIQKDHTNISCVIPAYRPDIISQIDLIEEIALGYGTWRLEPVLSHSKTFGNLQYSVSSVMRAIDMSMIGMSFVEALNSCLTGTLVLYEMTGRKIPKRNHMISTVNSKSSEHSVLRDSLLAGLIENLSKNIHESYPQKLYETGTVFLRRDDGSVRNDNLISEKTHLAAIIAYSDSNFSEAKSVLQSMLSIVYGDIQNIHTAAASHNLFADGRCAKVVITILSPTIPNSNSANATTSRTTKNIVGYVGEIDSEILSSYRIRVPASGFEISLSDSLPLLSK